MKTHELSLRDNGPGTVRTVCGLESPFEEGAVVPFDEVPTCKTCLRNGRHKGTPVAPSIHLNGSGIKNLTDQYEEALEAVSNAINALPVPHGRDYYVLEDGSFEVARKQYTAQILKLNAVLEDLRSIYHNIRRQERGAA